MKKEMSTEEEEVGRRGGHRRRTRRSTEEEEVDGMALWVHRWYQTIHCKTDTPNVAWFVNASCFSEQASL